jgi:hypothetical protein
MVRPIEYTPNCLSLKDIAGHEVMVEVDHNSELIAGNPQGIAGQQLRLHPIHFLSIVITVPITYLITHDLAVDHPQSRVKWKLWKTMSMMIPFTKVTYRWN